MKKYVKILTVAFFSVALLLTLAISVGAVTYEPDGSGSSEYLFDASECNRTVVVNCVDESGNLIKTVTYFTKTGEDDLISLSIYGIDIVAFESDQGALETCKLTWCTGNSLGTYGYIQIEYYFRTSLSKKVMTATVTVRKQEPMEFTVRHFIQKRDQTNFNYKYYSLYDSSSKNVEYLEYVTSSSKTITGYHLKDGYESSISGNISYSWRGKSENIPYDTFEYDLCNTPWSEPMESYSKYHEDKDGKVDYCYNRKYYIDYYYDLNEYTISFDVNGGAGAPESIKKYYDLYIKIPDTIPTRDGYDFVGWGTYASDTSVNYVEGDQFTTNANTTLYAIWDQYDYEFSIYELEVYTPDELLPNQTVTVSVRTDSWDLYDPQSNIPVALYYDGKLLHTEIIDFAEFGVAYVDFDLNVGSSTGLHTVEVRINWNNKNIEVDPDNNTVSTTINVISDSYGFSVEALTGNGRYKEGLEVITSFLVYNNSERKVLPSSGATADFSVYFYCSNQKVVLEKQTWEELVIPVGESNLVYFRWTVPDGLAGNTIYCECTVNFAGRLKEGDLTDNVATLSTVVATRNESQTENPPYEAQAPNGFTTASAPSTQTGSAMWSVWEYENGTFVKRTYGIRVTASSPSVVPGSTCETAYYSGGKWTIKSGYGVILEFDPVTIGSLTGYAMPPSGTYTGAQSIYATFPEFRYSADEGSYRALEYSAGAWRFVENAGADRNERIHYIPVWFENGNYIIAVNVTDIWTPVGVLTTVRTSNLVSIDGNIFDDYYVGG